MRLGTVTQRPEERKSYSISYVEALDENDSVSTILHCEADPSGMEVMPVLVSDTRVRVWVRGGEMGKAYTITTRIETAGGEILEDQIICRIK